MSGTAASSPRALVALATLLLAAPPAVRAQNLVLTSMDDLAAAASYDPATRTYSVAATRVVVAGAVLLPLEGTVPANLACAATDEVVVEAAGSLRADGGDSSDPSTAPGEGGTISLSAPRVAVHGAITAKGGAKNGSSTNRAGRGGTLVVDAGALVVDGAVAANGGTAFGYFADLSGMGGTVRLTADEIDSAGAITANSDQSTGWSYHGGTIEIAARARASLGGTIAANGSDAFVFYGGNGGSVTVTGGRVAVTGAISADGSFARNGWMFGGTGGNVSVDVAELDLTAGMITANAGRSGEGNLSRGGTISIRTGVMAPADEPVVRAHVQAVLDGTITFDIRDVTPPVITIASPLAVAYPHVGTLALTFSATDERSAAVALSATLDGAAVEGGQTIDLLLLALGAHTLAVTATDEAGNAAQASVTFTVVATLDSLQALTQAAWAQNQITKWGAFKSLDAKIAAARALLSAGDLAGAASSVQDYVRFVAAQRGKLIVPATADQLAAEANSLLATGVR
jgi:hypothetical protein